MLQSVYRRSESELLEVREILRCSTRRNLGTTMQKTGVLTPFSEIISSDHECSFCVVCCKLGDQVICIIGGTVVEGECNV